MKKNIITILLAVAALTVQAQTKVWDNIVMGYANSLPEDITNTYWRNESTGDWMIGITPNHVIYKNKVWDIVSQTEKKDAYTLTINDGTIIKVGKMKKGQRIITIGKEKPATGSPIVTAALPDYPTKDLRKGFVDNGYRTNDSVTIIGWMKDMPQQAWERGKEFSVGIENIFSDKEESSYAKMDSLGRFTLKMPILNSSQVFLDWGRTSKSTVLEPGKNVVHYNLPADQQSAVEHFLQVHSWPTYKLIDRDGKVLDVNADPRNLESLAKLLDLMK